MTTNADLAALMYPEMNEPKPEEAVLAVNSLTQDLEHAEGRLLASAERMYGDSMDPQPLSEVTVDQLTAERLRAADLLMYQDGGKALKSVHDYAQQILRERFESFEFKARHDGNEAYSAALKAGRLQAAAALHEMSVPSEAAREIAGALEGWHSRWIAGAGNSAALLRQFAKIGLSIARNRRGSGGNRL